MENAREAKAKKAIRENPFNPSNPCSALLSVFRGECGAALAMALER